MVVMTFTLPARPTSAGTSKDSKAFTKISSMRPHSAGSDMRRVTLPKALRGLAPDIMAASSKEASVERRTDDISRKVSGTKPMPSISIMPQSE